MRGKKYQNKMQKPAGGKREQHKCCDHKHQPEIKITLKQRRWLQLYTDIDNIETFGNAAESAIVAYGYDPKTQRETAAQVGWENKRKLKLELVELMDESGISDAYLMVKLMENLNATKLYGQNAEEHMDGQARNKALEMALKMKKLLIDRVDHTSKNKQIKGLVTMFKLPSNGREPHS